MYFIINENTKKQWSGNVDWLIIILSYDEATKIDPNFKEVWNNKGSTLTA